MNTENKGLFIHRVKLPRAALDRLKESRSAEQSTTVPTIDIYSAIPGEADEAHLYGHDLEAAQRALQAGAQVKSISTDGTDSPLHRAAANGDVDIARLFLAHGADPNLSVKRSEEDSDLRYNISPLTCASTPEMVDCLVQGGADVNQARWSEQALDNPALAQAFLDHGMNPSQPAATADGLPALHTCENPVVGKLLVEHGADPQRAIRFNNFIIRPDQRITADLDMMDFALESKSEDFAQAIGVAQGQPLYQSPALRAALNDLGAAYRGIDNFQQKNATAAQSAVESNTHQEIPMSQPTHVPADEATRRAAPSLAAAFQQQAKQAPAVEAAPTQSQAPRSLAEAAARSGLVPPKQEAQSEGEGKGGRQGGQERPRHSSYYNPVPVGGISMPQRGSAIGDAVVQREHAQKRRHMQSI